MKVNYKRYIRQEIDTAIYMIGKESREIDNVELTRAEGYQLLAEVKEAIGPFGKSPFTKKGGHTYYRGVMLKMRN